MKESGKSSNRISRRTMLTTTAAGVSALSASIAQASTGKAGFFYNRNQSAGELVIYAWYQPWLEKVVPWFEEETGIKVTNSGSYSANAEWWARLMAEESFDFFIPSTDWIQRAMKSDLLHPIDTDAIPNIANLFPDFQNRDIYQKDGQTYVIPFARLLNCLTYNTNEFPEAPTTWDVTWDPKYSGKITMQDSSYLRVGLTALLVGDDPTNPESWDQISEKLMEQKGLVSKYWKDYQNGMELFVNEEVLVGELSDGRARMGAKMGGAIGWTVPEEGCIALIDTFAIPKTAKNPENAFRFIDFLLRPEVTVEQMTMLNYDTVNEAAYAELSPEVAAEYAAPEGSKFVVWEDLTPEVRQKMDDVWTEVLLT